MADPHQNQFQEKANIPFTSVGTAGLSDTKNDFEQQTQDSGILGLQQLSSQRNFNEQNEQQQNTISSNINKNFVVDVQRYMSKDIGHINDQSAEIARIAKEGASARTPQYFHRNASGTPPQERTNKSLSEDQKQSSDLFAV
ncbi:MAG: hypothetical protein EZS28_051359, partial [Streblomastix strix]